MHASSVQKIHTTELDAFSGIDYQQHSAHFEQDPFLIKDQHIQKIQKLNLINWTMQPIELEQFSKNLNLLIDQAPHILILQGYGTGNIAINDKIIQKLFELQNHNCAVILDTQVPFGGLDQRYAVSQWVKQANILINNTQSDADLYAKILKMYLQYPSADQWHDHWYQH